MRGAKTAGLRPAHDYWASRLDAVQIFGPDWLFGAFNRREPRWLESTLHHHRAAADGLRNASA